MNKKTKEFIKTIVKVVVTAGGLYIAYKQIDFSLIEGDISSYSWWIFFLCIGLNFVNVFIIAYRLFLILEKKTPFKAILKSNLMAVFFNLFLPSTIGGDVVKISEIKKSKETIEKSTISVLLDRFFGIVSLVLLSGGLSIYVHFTSDVVFPALVNYIVIGTFIGVIIAWIFIMVIDFGKLRDEGFKIDFWKIKKEIKFTKIFEALDEVRNLPTNKNIFLIFLSALYHLNASIIAYLGLQFLGVDIAITYVIIFRTISTLILMVPISIAGIGVRDLIYKELYGSVTDSQQVLLLAPFTLSILIVTGLVGGIIFLSNSKEKKV